MDAEFASNVVDVRNFCIIEELGKTVTIHVTFFDVPSTLIIYSPSWRGIL